MTKRQVPWKDHTLLPPPTVPPPTVPPRLTEKEEREKKVVWLAVLLGLPLFLLILYGSYWAYKNTSYSVWYEDMVKQTVAEMVKPEALK
jgi:hypothetical protein